MIWRQNTDQRPPATHSIQGCLTLLQLLSDSVTDKHQNHTKYATSHSSLKYNITNSCLLVLVDNLKTKTDRDEFFCLAAIYQFHHGKFVNW